MLNLYLASITYALKSIVRNFRRSLTLMFGVIISLTILSGVLFYIDTTSGELVERAFSDLSIDAVVSDTTLNEAEIKTLQDFCLVNVSDLIITSEIIAKTNPLLQNTIGAIVAANNNYSISAQDIQQSLLFNLKENYAVTYIFGVEVSYLEEFPFFITSENVSQIFENDEVLISTFLADFFINDTDNILNLSILSHKNRILETQLSMNLTVGGTVTFDTVAVEKARDAFHPEKEQLRTTTSILPSCIVCSYSKYMELMNGSIAAISLNGVHLKIDHDQLSSDPNVIYGQLDQITSTLEFYYIYADIINLLELSLDQVAVQLNIMRLILIYLALPGLIIGVYISKYAIDLTTEERKREIGILRTKAALRKHIAIAIGCESFIISGLGLMIGMFAGYLVSLSIFNFLNDGTLGLINVTVDSIIFCVVIGVIIVLIATLLSVRQILAPSVIATLKVGKEHRASLWRRIYLDIFLLSIVIIVIILNIFQFNPIPGFAVAIYDLAAPLLAWVGFTLLLVRVLERILQSFEEPIIRFYKIIFKDLGHLITKNILHKPQRITEITILLSLTLSFGLVIATISKTYQEGLKDDVMFHTGSDLRIQFPSDEYLDYNTSYFITSLENNYNDEILGTTAIYSSFLKFGRTPTLTIGIEPETFFNVCMVRNSFLQSNNIKETRNHLLDNSTGSYYNTIISNGLANPGQSIRTIARIGSPVTQEIKQTFEIGDILPIGEENGSEIKVTDIATHFPAVADLTRRSEDELEFIVCNVEFLKKPFPSSNISLISDKNASYLFVKVNNGFSPTEIEKEIMNWYNQNFPNSVEISITNVEKYYEDFLSFIIPLIGLTSMEFILVLAVCTLGLEIFLTNSLYERKKEFGTYYAIGGSVKDVEKLVLGELSLIIGFSIIIGTLLSVLISFMYMGLISDVLILEINSLVISLESTLVLLFLVIIAMIISILLSGRKLSRLDPVNILRTV